MAACNCITGFIFNETEAVCVVDCDLIDDTLGRLNVDTCICPDEFAWNSTSLTCIINCDMTYASGPTAGTINQCDCVNSTF